MLDTLDFKKLGGGIPGHADSGLHRRRGGNRDVRVQALRVELRRRRRRHRPGLRARAAGARLRHRADLGCHVNPAVTLGFIASGRMKLAEGVAYMVAQFAGGSSGPISSIGCSRRPRSTKSVQGLGTDGYGKESHLFVSQWGAFLIEVVLTAIFVLVVLFATHKAAIQGAAGVAIGFGLVIVHLIGIPLTGTSVNPARSLGPALIVGGTALSQVWLFIVAPLVGALIAAAIHLVMAGRPEDEIVVDPSGSTLAT